MTFASVRDFRKAPRLRGPREGSPSAVEDPPTLVKRHLALFPRAPPAPQPPTGPAPAASTSKGKRNTAAGALSCPMRSSRTSEGNICKISAANFSQLFAWWERAPS
jgi:hypothetical protein